MSVQLRPYQQRVVDSIRRALNAGMKTPCASVATGGGKTWILTTMAQTFTQKIKRCLTLTHVKELVGQLSAAATHIGLDHGVYAASLDRRDTKYMYTIAQIQSVHKRMFDLGAFDVVFVDECHLISDEDSSMYQRALDTLRTMNPDVRVVGLSATPFRMKEGLVYGPGKMFEACVEHVKMRELIETGYLTPLIGKNADRKFDASALHMRGGDFIAGELEDFMADQIKVSQAVGELVTQCSDRKRVLVFSSGNKHSRMIVDELTKLGQSSALVNGEMGITERDTIIAASRSGEVKYLVNCAVLTTGYDDPAIDCVAILRPTRSPGLLLQMAGRGLRLSPGKSSCLILDYGGCIAEGQEVLTDKGYVKIELVDSDALLWDGFDWIPHDGVIYKGEKEVITYAGITATPDHLFWTIDGWLPFGKCAEEGRDLVAGECEGIAIWESDNYVIREGACWDEDGLCSCALRLRSGVRQEDEEAGEWIGVVQGVRTAESSAEVAATPMPAAKAAVREQERQALRGLRRTGHSLYVPVTYDCCGLDQGEPWPVQGNATGQTKQQRGVCTRKPAVLQSAVEHAPHASVEVDKEAVQYSEVIPARNVPEVGNDSHVCGRVVRRADSGEMGEERRARTTRRVYDIRNAGPRNRFIVRGAIAHNCLSHFGPLDMIENSVRATGSAKEPGACPTKTCPECSRVIHAARMTCDCGYVWTKKLNHDEKASEQAVMSGMCERAVQRVSYSVQPTKVPGCPTTLRVTYWGSLVDMICSEFLSVDQNAHPYARRKALQWLRDTPTREVEGRMLAVEGTTIRGTYNGTTQDVVDAMSLLPYCKSLESPTHIHVAPDPERPKYARVYRRSFK